MRSPGGWARVKWSGELSASFETCEPWRVVALRITTRQDLFVFFALNFGCSTPPQFFILVFFSCGLLLYLSLTSAQVKRLQSLPSTQYMYSPGIWKLLPGLGIRESGERWGVGYSSTTVHSDTLRLRR